MGVCGAITIVSIFTLFFGTPVLIVSCSLDILNLFISILRILNGTSDD